MSIQHGVVTTPNQSPPSSTGPWQGGNELALISSSKSFHPEGNLMVFY